MCRKIAFLGFVQKYYRPLRSRYLGYLDSRAGPFLGYVKKYWFFGEIFTSEADCLARFKKYFPTIRNNTTAGEQWATRVNLIVTDLSNSETASDWLFYLHPENASSAVCFGQRRLAFEVSAIITRKCLMNIFTCSMYIQPISTRQGWPLGAVMAQACHAATAAIHLFYG